MENVTMAELAAIQRQLVPRYQMIVGDRSFGRTVSLSAVAGAAAEAGLEVVLYAPDEERRASLAADLGAHSYLFPEPVTFITGLPEETHPSQLRARLLLVDDWSSFSQAERNTVGQLIDELRPAITIVTKHSSDVPSDSQGRPQMMILAVEPAWLECVDVETHEPAQRFEFVVGLGPIPWRWTHDAVVD